MAEKEILIQISNVSEIQVFFDNELVCESDSRADPIHLLESVLSSLGFNVEVLNIELPEIDEMMAEIGQYDGEPYYEQDPTDLLED